VGLGNRWRLENDRGWRSLAVSLAPGADTGPGVASAARDDVPVPAPHPPEFWRRTVELAGAGEQPVVVLARQRPRGNIADGWRGRAPLRLPIVGTTDVRILLVASNAVDRVRAADSTQAAEGTRPAHPVSRSK
jgi:hypothetical protein